GGDRRWGGRTPPGAAGARAGRRAGCCGRLRGRFPARVARSALPEHGAAGGRRRGRRGGLPPSTAEGVASPARGPSPAVRRTTRSAGVIPCPAPTGVASPPAQGTAERLESRQTLRRMQAPARDTHGRHREQTDDTAMFTCVAAVPHTRAAYDEIGNLRDPRRVSRGDDPLGVLRREELPDGRGPCETAEEAVRVLLVTSQRLQERLQLRRNLEQGKLAGELVD